IPASLDLLDPAVLPRLRGVLSFHALYELDGKLSEAGVPVIYLGAGPPCGTGVFLDDADMLRQGMRRLAQVGCRNAMLLHPVSGDSEYNRARIAAAAARACDLKFANEPVVCEQRLVERHGYDAFMRLWRGGRRPQGVMVSDEILCHGVLRAVLELRLDLPRDLQLISHASRGVAFPYAGAVSRLEFDTDAWADRALRMLIACIHGQPPRKKQERLRAVWVPGDTTGK
ncbi:MAG: substrate-binding domain-containing protein, partial [Kiritimatiellae bacterium]|nr:substrate-binding domain-containing protein [Kiritimatiellia bacterium]